MTQFEVEEASVNRVVRVIGESPEVFGAGTYRNATVVEFEGRAYPISHRAILTLVTLAGCNVACKFCSNEITFTPGGPYLAYDERLQRVIRLAHLAGVEKIAFTGGEPTMHPGKLLAVARATIPGFARARLHSNGFGLFKEVRFDDEPMPLLDALIRAGLSGLSVSVAHHDHDTNRDIMRFPRTWNGMSEDDLRTVAGYRDENFTPRLSCVFTPEGVNDVDGLRAYLEWGRSLGFRNFIFRSASGIPGEFSKATAYSSYNSSAHTEIHALTDELEGLPGWMETFTQHKSDSHVHVFNVDGECVVDVDDSSEEVDPDDKIRRLIMMPNGVLYSSWIDPLSAIFEQDRERAERDAKREFGFVPAASVAASATPR